jgi:molybdopterin synthase catalytic subunit
MPIEILYFGAAREAAGARAESLPIAPATVADLRRALVERHPGLAAVLTRSRIAVDEAFAADDDAVHEGAEVAIIPPVAGGGGFFRISDQPLRLAEVVEAVGSPAMGAVVTFSGAVREASHGRRVLRLEYEAYAPMAERVLAQLGAEVGEAHGAVAAVVHRVGVLAPGELAVVIACAAPHRGPAFRACEEVLERLKRDAPIWKREVFEDGSEWVGLGP